MGRKEKIFELAKGYRGRAKNCITASRARVEKGLQYAYRDRRTKKREFRSLWITRINAGVRGESDAVCGFQPSRARSATPPALTLSRIVRFAEHDYSYSRFTHGQNLAGVVLNRKILAELAVYEPWSFKSVVDVVRASDQSASVGLHSTQLQQALIVDRITMAAEDPEAAKEALKVHAAPR
jgi:large subunit ribosomal protein L20